MFYCTLELWKGTKIYSVGKRIPSLLLAHERNWHTQFVVWCLKSLNLCPRVYWQRLRTNRSSRLTYTRPKSMLQH